jgi:type VI secretion system protein ImpA
VVRGIVENFWDGFYPRLDPDEANDPTFRVNILMSLCDGSTFIDRIRTVPLVASRTFGRFSLRDMAVASGELPPVAGAEPPKAATIEGAFNECPLPELQATADAVRAATASLAAIETFVGDKVGAASGTNFSKLQEVLRTAEKALATRLARRGVGAEIAAASEGPAVGSTSGVLHAGGPSISGEINSREDVIRTLEKVCSYYERYEPSSPIPLLVQRAKRLVSASFLDIVRDLAPDGLAQIENLKGKDETQSS